MRTNVESPLGHLSAYPRVNMELELSGKHHEMLLSGNKNQYERVATAVIQDLLGSEYKAERLSMAELYYYFFVAKSQSLGPTWNFNWSCPKPKIVKGVERTCSTENEAVYDIRKFKPKQLERNFTPAKYKINLVSVGSVIVEPGTVVDCWIKPLQLEKEFDIIDFLLGNGEDRGEMLRKNPYAYLKRRAITAMHIDHPALEQASYEEKAEQVEANSIKLVEYLIRDTKSLDDVGYPMIMECPCKECGGTTSIRLPFHAGLLLSAK